MRSSKRMLAAFAELRRSGFPVELEPGRRLARSFADLGSEEFVVVPGPALLSLFTGERKAVTADGDQHLFTILSCDEMVDRLQRLNFDVQSLIFEDQRHWILTLVSVDRTLTKEYRAALLEEVLVAALKDVYRKG